MPASYFEDRSAALPGLRSQRGEVISTTPSTRNVLLGERTGAFPLRCSSAGLFVLVLLYRGSCDNRGPSLRMCRSRNSPRI